MLPKSKSKLIAGQSLLEVVLALAIFSLIAAAFISLTLGSVSNVGYGTDFLTATALADQGLGATRVIRDNAWNTLTDGVENAIFDGRFNRAITVSPINLETKSVKVEVSWPSPAGTTQKVTRQTKLTNWDSRDWIQTDWSGGRRQKVWSDPTRYDDGNLDVGVAGELKLRSTASAGGGYETSGWLISSAFDLGDPSPVQLVGWAENIPACSPACAIKLNIKVASTRGGLNSVPWSPDFTLAAGTLIDPSYNGNRWAQYRVSLTGDGLSTPVLQEVRINYK